jgi:transposase/predicted transcriptional regulator
MSPAGAASAPRLVWEVSEQGESLLTALFPHLAGLRVHRVEDIGHAVVISASCRAGQACCPECGSPSARVHGGYSRMMADGAVGGRPVLIILAVRRFRCPDRLCAKVTFAEQAEGLTVRYRRRSVPLLGMLAGFGLELGGRAAARLAGALGVPVHSSTVLRLVMALPDPPVTAAPAVTGVDDFALRKGHVYGTVVADAESGDVTGLLPDREAGTLEAWLKAHPGAEVICRDRAGAYAEGAAAGAPGAVQVADRWHLWHNLGEYAEKAVVAHRGCLAGTPDGPAAAGEDAPVGQLPDAAPAVASPPGPDGLLDVCGRERALVSRTRERHAAVHELLQAGRSQREAAEILGLSPRTVSRFARERDAAGLLVRATSRESKLDPFKPWIDRLLNEGLTSAVALHAEMAATLGWTGSLRAVQRYVRQFRAADGRTRAGRTTRPAPAAPPVPKTRQITRWLLSRPGSLDAEDQAQLTAVTAACPHLDALAGHIRSFAEMMTRRQGLLALEGWLTAVEASDQPQLHSFATGIRRDQQAVTAGLALPFSSAAMEGNVNKIKMIKRQMYGRAGFALLRKRVILHPG